MHQLGFRHHLKCFTSYRLKKSIKAFTLFELALVILIISFLGMFAGPILKSVGDVIFTEYAINNLNTQGRIALERMAREIRLVRSSQDLTVSASSISFVDTEGNVIAYSLSGNSLLRNSQVLTENISALNFVYYNSSGVVTATVADIRYIKIALSLSENDSYTSLETTVYPRALSS